MIFIDSNIWCYYFDKSSKEHQTVAKKLEYIISREHIAINTVIAMEVSHFLVKNLGPTRAKEKLHVFLEWPMTFVDFDYEQMINAFSKLYEWSHLGIGGRDATILAAMKKIGAKKLVTHDSDFDEVEEIEVIDPLK